MIAGERAAWSFALVGVAAARFGADVRMAAIGVSNLPRPIDPGDPAAGLPGLEMTRWKRRLLETLASMRAPPSGGERADPRVRRAAAAPATSRGVQHHPGSTPVVGFGDPRNAKVATIGLNPNRLEFLNAEGSLLRDDDQRLETLLSVGGTPWPRSTRTSWRASSRAATGTSNGGPTGGGSTSSSACLNGIGVSYYRGTACHLTLVQWATNPTWGSYPSRRGSRSCRRTLRSCASESPTSGSSSCCSTGAG